VRYCSHIMQRKPQRRVLVIDVGGSHVKTRVSAIATCVSFESGATLTPRGWSRGCCGSTGDLKYDAVSIGYPGVVVHGKIVTEPFNSDAVGWF